MRARVELYEKSVPRKNYLIVSDFVRYSIVVLETEKSHQFKQKTTILYELLLVRVLSCIEGVKSWNGDFTLLL